MFMLCAVFSLLSSQDENDNPPTFSKPSYVITVMEDIMAGLWAAPVISYTALFL